MIGLVQKFTIANTTLDYMELIIWRNESLQIELKLI